MDLQTIVNRAVAEALGKLLPINPTEPTSKTTPPSVKTTKKAPPAKTTKKVPPPVKTTKKVPLPAKTTKKAPPAKTTKKVAAPVKTTQKVAAPAKTTQKALGDTALLKALPSLVLHKKDGIVTSVGGDIKIGSKNLLVDVDGKFNSDGTIYLDTFHKGGWKALDDPVVITPKMTGPITVGGEDGFIVGNISGTLSDKVVMIPGLLTLQSRSTTAKGPTFGLTINKESEGTTAEITPFFTAKICIKLDDKNHCLPVRVEPKAEETASTHNIYNIWGEYTGGNIRPLASLGNPFANVVKIKGSPETPLGVNLEADINHQAVGVTLTATLSIDIEAFGKPVELRATTVGRLVKSGPAYALMGTVQGITLPAPFGKVPPVTVTVASTEIPNVLITGVDERMDVKKGISLYWSGVSPVPAICNSKLIFSFTVSSLKNLGGDVTCPLNLVFLKNKVKSINFIKMSSIVLGFSVVKSKTQNEVGISVGAGFEIATGPADCSDKSSSSECLSADITVGLVNVKPVLTAVPPTPGGKRFEASIGFRGAWINPLGLRNFALVNPGLAIGVFYPTGSAVPVLKKLSYGITVLWKRPSQVAN